jgi:hypothetical protein
LAPVGHRQCDESTQACGDRKSEFENILRMDAVVDAMDEWADPE